VGESWQLTRVGEIPCSDKIWGLSEYTHKIREKGGASLL